VFAANTCGTQFMGVVFMSAAIEKSKVSADVFSLGGFLAVLSLLALLLTAGAEDSLMQVHAWVMLGAFLLGLAALVMRYSNGMPADVATGYENGVVKAGVFASMFWGVAGFLVGVIIAFQLAFPALLSWDALPFLNFGRLRPLHTSAVIFAFGGNVLIATSFYVVQRTCRARLGLGAWAWFVFWGYQLFIVLAATGYLMGVTQGKE
jgi:cytochrome c oxidase cbb3-type subunit I